MTPLQHKELTNHKQDALFAAIEVIEGRVFSNFEIKEFCFIEQREGRPCEELVYWRLKPILHFKWRPSNGELRILKLYPEPPPSNEDEKKTKDPSLED